MAKIGNLQVDTLNIANNAITGEVKSTTSLVVPNSASLPVQIFYRGNAYYTGVTSGAWGNVTVTITRARDGAILYQNTVNFSGTGNKSQSLTCATLDTGATSSETYNISVGANRSDLLEVTALGVNNADGLARYVKK